MTEDELLDTLRAMIDAAGVLYRQGAFHEGTLQMARRYLDEGVASAKTRLSEPNQQRLDRIVDHALGDDWASIAA
jgi:hypothetical protein